MTKPKLVLEEFTLRSGRSYLRPAGTLGTMGWSPFPWEIQPRKVFLAMHAEYLKDYEVTFQKGT